MNSVSDSEIRDHPYRQQDQNGHAKAPEPRRQDPKRCQSRNGRQGEKPVKDEKPHDEPAGTALPVLLRLGYVESCAYSLREILCSPYPPVVEKHDPRLLADHVLMNCDDVDASPAELLQNQLQLRLEHGKVAIDKSFVARADERRPRIHPHLVADFVTVHARGSAERGLVDAILEVTPRTQNRVELLRVETGLFGIDVRSLHFGWSAARLFDLGEDLPHRTRDLGFVTHAADVHEHHDRRLPEKMIVQRGDLESVVERDAHHRIHLVFAEHHVAHDHRLLAGLLEGSPGSEPHRWCNANGPRENLEIAARSGDLVDLLLLVELPFQTGELVD